MFKATLNLMKINVTITPQTPLLVASGKTFDVTRPDIQFVRMATPYGETVYIPGSSIKGVLRGGMEAVLGENERWKTKICCTSEKLCHDLHRAKRELVSNKVPYREHCPVCRMFGSGDLASHLEISDLFPFAFDAPEEEKKEKIAALQAMVTTRSGIKIDRKTGKTSPGALFQYEILGGGELFGELTFTNYELYQPGMLFMLFDLSNEGFLRYGHSKSRGLGVLKFDIGSIKIMQMGKLKGKILKGAGIFSQPGGTGTDYGFYTKGDDKIDKEYPCEENILYSTFTFSGKEAVTEVSGMIKARIDAFLSLPQA